jgi:hypothetical protein
MFKGDTKAAIKLMKNLAQFSNFPIMMDEYLFVFLTGLRRITDARSQKGPSLFSFMSLEKGNSRSFHI